jgi:hypothetical protein
MTIYADQNADNWSDSLDSLLFAYRTSYCASTGFSPFELLFGRKPVLPAQLAYDLNPHQLDEEKSRNISVSSSMVKAMRFANQQQSKIAAANKARRDVGRVDVAFHSGDMVWKYDKAYAAGDGTSKLQYRFSGPYVVRRRSSWSPNLYHITHISKRVSTTCNVDLLVLVKNDCEDIGPPLGAPQSFPHEGFLHLGDMVAIIRPTTFNTLGKVPFLLGRISSIHQEGKLTVWWYGNDSNNIRGAIKPGWVAGPNTINRYFGTRRCPRHYRLCSEFTGTAIHRYAIIGNPFKLTTSGMVPRATLTEISRDTRVPWSLPERDLVMCMAIQRR